MQVLDLAVICKFILELFLGRFLVDICDEHDPPFDRCPFRGRGKTASVKSANHDETDDGFGGRVRVVWNGKRTYNGRRAGTRCYPCSRGVRTWPRLPSNPSGLYGVRNCVSVIGYCGPRVATYGPP